MPRREATITQADIARAIRAAKQTGAAEVEVRVNERSKIIIRLEPSTGDGTALEKSGDIVL
jgi:DNA-binding XRE family transcriptional regulator